MYSTSESCVIRGKRKSEHVRVPRLLVCDRSRSHYFANKACRSSHELSTHQHQSARFICACIRFYFRVFDQISISDWIE